MTDAKQQGDLTALREAILAIPEYADGGDESTPVRLVGTGQTIYHDYYIEALETVVSRAAEVVGL